MGPDIVVRYVAEGFGAGLAFHPPDRPLPGAVRALPLSGFPGVVFGVLWLGPIRPLGALLLEEAAGLARELTAGGAPS